MNPTVLVFASLGDPPFVGGIENVVDTLLNSELSKAFEFAVFDTYRVPDPHRTLREKAAYAGRLFLTSRTRVREIEPDIVHIHFCSRADFWKHAICLAVSRSFGAKTIFHLHGGSFDAFYAEMNRLQKSATKRIFGLADRVIALSSYWKEFLSGLAPPHNISVLNNPIDCERLAPGKRAPDPANPTLLLLGSLGRRKGHYDVLRALPLVVKKHPNVKVLFAGADEDHGATETLKRLAREADLTEHVEFLGPVSFEPKVELLRTSTILILPSYAENMPISVLEGMAARMPVVSTRVGALPEVLDGGEAGLMIEPGDWEALAQSINRILDDPPFAARLGEVAGKRARRLWDVKRIASRIDVVYREVLSLERA
jgi:glycosyltransferase involved in cell wall biosynthesis